MRATAISRATRLAWNSLAGIFLMVFAGCSEPTYVAWNETQSVIEPEVPPPQGELEVYSEGYVFYDADVPRTHRPPVQVYSVDGQLVASAPDQDGEGPIHFALTPGHYIVTSDLQARASSTYRASATAPPSRPQHGETAGDGTASPCVQ